jgi:hypothetical protein
MQEVFQANTFLWGFVVAWYNSDKTGDEGFIEGQRRAMKTFNEKKGTTKLATAAAGTGGMASAGTGEMAAAGTAVAGTSGTAVAGTMATAMAGTGEKATVREGHSHHVAVPSRVFPRVLLVSPVVTRLP